MTLDSSRPLLAVDIDGVISIFAEGAGLEPGSTPTARAGGRFEYLLVDGIPHCISLAAGERLQRLSPHFELFWASGWEDKANDHLPQLIGIEHLPHLALSGTPDDDEHWKLGPLADYAGERPLAWIDDNLDQSCFDWASTREAPTLLIQTEPEHGLEEAHAEVLMQWVEQDYDLGDSGR